MRQPSRYDTSPILYSQPIIVTSAPSLTSQPNHHIILTRSLLYISLNINATTNQSHRQANHRRISQASCQPKTLPHQPDLSRTSLDIIT
jgi:hypothetical protein